MAEVTVELIKRLRDKTNAGMMDCKAALKEAGGDLEEAETVLRKKGIAGADKKAGRAATEGVISSKINQHERCGVLVELNCETDFVAKNENFRSFVKDLTEFIAEGSTAEDVHTLLKEEYDKDPGTTVEEALKAKVGELGENLVLRRIARFTVADGMHGVIASYIHMGKAGVLLEAGCENDATTSNDAFRELVKNITLHIAASHPVCVTREQVPAAAVAKEKEIYSDQVKDKPAAIVDRIVGGKLEKFFSTVCLLEQAFIKDTDKSVEELLKEKSAEVRDTIVIRRFERFAVGEEI